MDLKKKKSIEEKESSKEAPSKQLAKKDFLIVHNEIRIEIKEGQDLGELNIPDLFWPNLKTEGVI